MQPAKSATPDNRATAIPSVSGSLAATWYNILLTNRPPAKHKSVPSAIPHTIKDITSRTTMRISDPGVAPRAARMPISARRRETEYDHEPRQTNSSDEQRQSPKENRQERQHPLLHHRISDSRLQRIDAEAEVLVDAGECVDDVCSYH